MSKKDWNIDIAVYVLYSKIDDRVSIFAEKEDAVKEANFIYALKGPNIIWQNDYYAKIYADEPVKEDNPFAWIRKEKVQ